MPGPSAAVLRNRVDLYRFTPVQDPDGGVSANPYGTAFNLSVPCSVQPGETLRYIDDQTGRIVQKQVYKVLFGTDPGLKLDDKIAWVDSAGVTHSLFVLGSPIDNAGRAYMWTASCEERV